MENQLEFSFMESKDGQRTVELSQERQAVDTRATDSPCQIHDEDQPGQS